MVIAVNGDNVIGVIVGTTLLLGGCCGVLAECWVIIQEG
jgi:hypothetical protein